MCRSICAVMSIATVLATSGAMSPAVARGRPLHPSPEVIQNRYCLQGKIGGYPGNFPRTANVWLLPRVQTPIAASIPSTPFGSGRDIGKSFYGMGTDDHHDLLGAALRPA